MREKGKGVILNIVAGAGEGLKKDVGAYLSSKAGLAALSNEAEKELSAHGIRVHTIENSVDVVKEIMSLLEAK